MSDNEPNFSDDAQAPPLEEFDESAEEAVEEEPGKKALNANTLLLLGLMAAVGLGTYLMCKRASSELPRPDAQVSAASVAINTFLTGGASEQYKLNALQRDTDKIVARFSNPSTHQIPLTGLHTNPFNDPQDQAPVSLKVDVARERAEEERKAAEALTKGLKLESIVYGSHSTCMINGRPYAVGQGNEKFTIEQIDPTGVWIRVGVLKLELTMKASSVSVDNPTN